MRFPKFHLATSVVNRIMDIANQVESIPMPTQPPRMPETAAQGAALDKALATPPPAIAAPAGADELVATEQMAGGNAADAVAAAGIIDAFQQ